MNIEEICLSEFRNSSNEILHEVADDGKFFIILKKKQPYAVLISIEDFRLLRRLKNKEK